MKKFTIEMCSRFSDFDVTLSGVPYEDARDAEMKAPNFMARPETWLVVQVTDEETGLPQIPQPG